MFQPCLRTSYLYWQFINFLNFIRYVHFGFFIILLINNMHSEEMYYYHTFLFSHLASQGSNSFILILDSKDVRQISRNFLCILLFKTMCAGILRGTGLQMFGAAMSFIANVLIALPLSLSLMFATSLSVTGKCSLSQKTQFLGHRKSVILKTNAFIDKRIVIGN